MLTNAASAASRSVTVRVHAADAAGGWITETVNNAYVVGAGAGSTSPSVSPRIAR